MSKGEYQPKPLSERHAAFEASLREGGYGHDVHRWPYYCNVDILNVYAGGIGRFGRAEWLDRDRFAIRYEEVRQVGRPQTHGYRRSSDGDPSWTTFRNAGNLINWGVRLGLLAQEEVGGVRGWRILDWDPHWEIDTSRPGAEMYRVKGGTPAERAERERLAKLDRTREKLRATLARKAAVAAVSNVGWYLNRILEGDPEFRIPEAWCTCGFVPGSLSGAFLSACYPTIREACVTGEFDKIQLGAWRNALLKAQCEASAKARVRERAAEEAAQHEDDAALAALADLGGLS